jgi:hypothetical protein
MKRRSKTKKEAEKFCQTPLINGCAKMSTVLAAAGVFLVFFLVTLFVTKEMVGWKQRGGFFDHGKQENAQVIANLQMQVNILKKQVGELKIKDENPATQVSANSLAANQSSSAFESAVNAKDFTKVEALLADNVYYVIDSSDCCGDITKEEAVQNFKNYIKSVKSFDFDQNQQVVRQMKVNLAETFSKYTIGIGNNQMVLSYQVNKLGKINNIMLSASHLMYDLE